MTKTRDAMTTKQPDSGSTKGPRATRDNAPTDSKCTRGTSSAHSTISDEQLLARLQGHLQFLGLTHTLRHLDDRLAWARHERPGATGLLDYVLGTEVAAKRDARIDRRFHNSGLPERKTLEAFNWDFQPSLDKDIVVELGHLDFVERAEDVVITGQAGTGKSHILKAIGLRACERGVSIRYARCVDLLDDLHAGLADGTYPQRLRAWARPKLLIIDDVGLGQLKKRDDEPTAAHTLYNLVDRRHTHASTAITSNIELSDWGRYLGDATLTAAILDRLVMHAIRFKIDGPSYRQEVAQQRANKRSQSRADRKKPKA
jgi:DNA replication protein DnaC